MDKNPTFLFFISKNYTVRVYSVQVSKARWSLYFEKTCLFGERQCMVTGLKNFRLHCFELKSVSWKNLRNWNLLGLKFRKCRLLYLKNLTAIVQRFYGKIPELRLYRFFFLCLWESVGFGHPKNLPKNTFFGEWLPEFIFFRENQPVATIKTTLRTDNTCHFVSFWILQFPKNLFFGNYYISPFSF